MSLPALIWNYGISGSNGTTLDSHKLLGTGEIRG